MRSYIGITVHFKLQATQYYADLQPIQRPSHVYLHQITQMGFAFFLKMFQDKCIRDYSRDYFQCTRNRLHCYSVCS